MTSRSYEDLRVWKEAMMLAKAIYGVTRAFPKEETYGLTQQIRRSAVSVASNIAEGSERGSKKEFTHFLCIAAGSLAELKTQLLIACDVFASLQPSVLPLLAGLDDVSKMLGGLRKSVSVPRATSNEQRTTSNEQRIYHVA